MEILKLLQERHTTKKYDASRKISDADFDLLLESLRLAPSSVNSQPWEFFIADTKEAKEKLLPAIADFNHSRVTDSDRLIVCAIHTDLDEPYMQALDDQEEADGRYMDPAYKVDSPLLRRQISRCRRNRLLGRQAVLHCSGFPALHRSRSGHSVNADRRLGRRQGRRNPRLARKRHARSVRRRSRLRLTRRSQCGSPEVSLAGSTHLP